MKQYLYSRRSQGVSGVVAVVLTALAAGPAVAKPAPIAQSAVDTSACVNPQLSQPFLSANDTSLYTLAAGEAPDSFTGTGWTLSSGARIITTKLADGQTGSVLDLPARSQAVSPVMCVTSDYPTARTLVQGASADGITFSVSYAGAEGWDKVKKTGKIQTKAAGWSVSDPFSINPGDILGWQLVQFTFSSKHDDAQLYNFYVDPRMRG